MLSVERFSDSFFENRSRIFDEKKEIIHFDESFGYKALSEPLLPQKMPVDFASYLMSSSPPGFGLYSALSVNSLGLNRFGPPRPILIKSNSAPTIVDAASGSPLKSDSPVCVCYTCSRHNSAQISSSPSRELIDNGLFALDNIDHNINLNNDDDEDDEDLECQCRRLSLEDSADSENEFRPIQSCSISKGNKRRGSGKNKRVTFADCNGLSLTEVRIMTESSDTPPNLRPHLLSSLTDGALPGVTEIPPLKLDFSQPASDYYTFREKLRHQNVCLENVILKDYNVLGTVKVRNLSFDKSVEIRVTFDSWKTFTDLKANYVPTGDESGALQYDTFAFELRVPSVLSRNQPVEFCIHYHCDAGDFWDNNEGQNYCIVTIDYNKQHHHSEHCTADFRPKFSDGEIWSEYSVWHMSDAEAPYY